MLLGLQPLTTTAYPLRVQNSHVVPLRGVVFNQLDSRLRGNDEAWDPAGVLVLYGAERRVGQSRFIGYLIRPELLGQSGH